NYEIRMERPRAGVAARNGRARREAEPGDDAATVGSGGERCVGLLAAAPAHPGEPGQRRAEQQGGTGDGDEGDVVELEGEIAALEADLVEAVTAEVGVDGAVGRLAAIGRDAGGGC